MPQLPHLLPLFSSSLPVSPLLSLVVGHEARLFEWWLFNRNTMNIVNPAEDRIGKDLEYRTNSRTMIFIFIVLSTLCSNKDEHVCMFPWCQKQIYIVQWF